MALSYNQMAQNDVMTELLSVCDLRFSRAKILDQASAHVEVYFEFTSRMKGPVLVAELSSASILVEWSVQRANTHPFFENLPKSFSWKGSSRVACFTELIKYEISNPRPGSMLIVDNLALSLFVLSIRDLVDCMPGFRSPIKSPNIFKAIRLIHEDPSYNWNIIDLAKKVGESKSSFNRKFRSFVGIPAHKYIRNWRITIAQKRLLSEEITLDNLAVELGFSGQASLSRAFREVTGVYPKSWIHSKKNSIDN